MCVFCAAVPATLAVGANLNVKQLRTRRKAEEREEVSPKKRIPVWTLTFVATGTLVVASVVYHSQFNG